MWQESIQDHNQQVAALWDSFGRRQNPRVPVTFASDEALWLHLTGRGFAEFYQDPRVHLETNLAGLAWMADNVRHDQAAGPPAEAWTVAPRYWMDEAACLGCAVALQDDSYAWARPLELSREGLLAHLRDRDPREAVLGSPLWRLYQEVSEVAQGLTFRGLPVRVIPPGAGTHGVFTVACHVRGVEALCTDLLEAPDFAAEFLGLLTERTLGRIRAWLELTGGAQPPYVGGWGCCDDSIQLLSAETYRRCVLPHHRALFDAMTSGPRQIHLCGHAQQHFGTLYHELGIRTLDGPGPFVDHGALLAELPELTLNAQVDHAVLLLGPEGAIERMMADLLTPAAKQPGRLQVMGYIGPHTPLRHVEAMYEAGLRYGLIGA
jgi:hypothetical protein